MPAVHEEAAALEWSCYYNGGVNATLQSFVGPAYVVLSSDEYVRFMAQEGFDFIGRKGDVLLNIHMEPLQALAFRAYQQDSRHAH